MAHRNAEKGKRWERWCGSFLGVPRRKQLGEHNDQGDLEDPDFIYECKDDNSRSPVSWWDQAEASRERASKPWSMVLAKTACLTRKPKKPTEPEGWAIQSIEQWKVLREYIAWLESYVDSGMRADALRVLFSRTHSELADSEMPVPPGHPSDRPSESPQGIVLVPGRRREG